MSSQKTIRPYTLESYNPEWKNIFIKTAEEIRPLFGTNLLAIEHVGSTSVEGMIAKPQIDVLAIVKDLDLIPEIYSDFESIGYVPRGREYVGIGDEYVTKDAKDGKRLAGIHIFEDGHPRIKEYREFREYLRNNEEDKEKYIDIKKRLLNSGIDIKGYDKGKSEVVNEILKRAREWAKINPV